VGKTLAILGFGKVGSEVARRAKGLGMHVIAHDPYASADRARAIGVELVSMEEAMTTADFISLHMPLTPATNKMLNDEAFAKMKKGVRIINVARGGVIDEEALVRALDSGIVAQVCLIILTRLLVFLALMKFSEPSLRCFPGIMLIFFQFFCILGCS
jgi:D-3-phosphoglycerate dehydrogenase